MLEAGAGQGDEPEVGQGSSPVPEAGAGAASPAQGCAGLEPATSAAAGAGQGDTACGEEAAGADGQGALASKRFTSVAVVGNAAGHTSPTWSPAAAQVEVAGAAVLGTAGDTTIIGSAGSPAIAGPVVVARAATGDPGGGELAGDTG